MSIALQGRGRLIHAGFQPTADAAEQAAQATFATLMSCFIAYTCFLLLVVGG
jgi:hypothetical protein